MDPEVGSAAVPDRPLNLRPSTRPGLVRVLLVLLFVGGVLVVLGGPVWFFMHSAAAGWQEDRPVVASVAEGTRCRVGPPPGEPTTCSGSWSDGEREGEEGEGDVSNRYGGPPPVPGERVEAREVGDDLALTGYHPVLLGWALVAPFLTVVGAAGALVAAVGLRVLDPRWWSRRTDLPTG